MIQTISQYIIRKKLKKFSSKKIEIIKAGEGLGDLRSKGKTSPPMNRNIINKILDIHSKNIWMVKMIKVNKEYGETCKYIDDEDCLEVTRGYCTLCKDDYASTKIPYKRNGVIETGWLYNTWLCGGCDDGSDEPTRISKNYY